MLFSQKGMAFHTPHFYLRDCAYPGKAEAIGFALHWAASPVGEDVSPQVATPAWHVAEAGG
jgi:hypothetical protein